MGIMQKMFQLKDGTTLPAVGFGTYLVTPADASQAVRMAIELGYRHVDTAEVYQPAPRRERDCADGSSS